MGKHYWREILPKVLELEEQGHSHRMAAEKLGYTQEQIKKLVKRYHKNQRKTIQPSGKRGRPRKRPISTEQEYQARIKQLEMENELLRSFLQTAGRR
jgi:transposase